MSEPLNYAKEYSRELANAFPYTLYFGALYATPNNGRYRMGENGKTVEIPTISTTGRVNASRDTIGTAARNYDNDWETKVLENQRKWSTLVHPKDIGQTNGVATIANITQTFNETQKFPEMDAFTISKIYADWGTTYIRDTETLRTADTTALTISNVLDVFDNLMLKMDNELVPQDGRILYCTHEVKKLLKNADKISRSLSVEDNNTEINRQVTRLDEVEIVGVPANLMKTKYNFTTGWTPASDADQINMALIHPLSVITPISYQFATLDAPSATTEGKYYYYEESFEDVFILNEKSGGIQFNITEHS